MGDVADVFGPDSIRATRSHAKFVLIRNEAWAVLITTSMNLNLNPRIEQFEMTDDAARADLFAEFADALFDELAEGSTEDRQMPGLHGMESVQPHLDIEVGAVTGLGRVSVGVDAR